MNIRKIKDIRSDHRFDISLNDLKSADQKTVETSNIRKQNNSVIIIICFSRKNDFVGKTDIELDI